MADPLLMVLEDHPILRKSVTLALSSLGHQDVRTAANGLEALQQLRQNGSVDIVICDIHMPEMDGLTFLRLAAQEQLIKAVILVSEVSPELRRAILHLASLHKLQVLGEIGKPVCLSTLAEQLSDYEYSNKTATTESPYLISIDAILQAFKNQEFETFFQPKINFTTDLECGAEALIRWNHAELGTLSPIHFLSLIRHHNLQFELTKVVLEHSLAFIATGSLSHPLNSVSINLEIADLQHPELVSLIEDRIRHYRIPASALTLEITEGELDPSPATSLENLIRLRLLGCGISIDDFGTGYSSLQRLCDTPCTEIKLDASFVRRMQSSRRARESVASTISLARHLELSIVAEGIETMEQLQSLRALGCNTGQGYLFAPAMPSNAYRRWRESRPGPATNIVNSEFP